MMMSIVKQCFSESTMHGIPNMANRKSRTVKIVWVVLTMFAIGILIAHSRSLVMKYLEESVSISIVPKSIPFQQPDILLCPKRLFALEYIRHPPPDEFQFINNVSLEMLRVEEKRKSLNLPMQSEVFFNNLDIWKIFRAFSYRQSQLFVNIECVTLHSRVSLVNYTLTPEYNWPHYLCYRIRPDMCKLSFPTYKLVIKLYIHDFTINQTSQIKNISELLNKIDFPVSNGIIVYFLNPNEEVQDNSEKVTVAGGTEMEISIKSVQYQFLNRKDFQCLKLDPLIKFRNFHLTENEKEGMNYTNSSVCYLNTYCNAIYNKWNCKFSSCPSQADRPLVDNFCFNFSTVHSFIPILKDLQNNLPLDDSTVYKQCIRTQPCSYTQYTATANSADIRPNLFVVTNSKLLNDLATNKNPGIKEFIERYRGNRNRINKFAVNLIMLHIYPGEFQSTQFVESFKYDLRNLFTDVGGILGFYIGASILTVFELYNIIHELLTIGVIYRMIRQRKKLHNEDQSNLIE